MQEQILELFKKDNKALTVDEIFDILALTTVDDLKSLMKILLLLVFFSLSIGILSWYENQRKYEN